MNNKMAKNTYQQLNLKEQTKQTRTEIEIMDTESILMVAGWERVVGEWVKR